MNKKIIVAGGGIVVDSSEKVLLIFRRGKWDLPKGKLDEGETIEACAVREVTEETGIVDIELGDLITKTYHDYFDEWLKEDVTKETWWFAMRIANLQEPTPQLTEDISKAIWVGKEELGAYLADTYKSIEEVIRVWMG